VSTNINGRESADWSVKRRRLCEAAKEKGLVEPVAQLLAAVYEPRTEGDVVSEEFDKLIRASRERLRKELEGLTSREGGRVEVVAHDLALKLL